MVWPALRQWALEVSHTDELVVMYAASSLAGEGGFAGEVPDEITDLDVGALAWTRSGPREPPRFLGARLRLWLELPEAWTELRSRPDVLDAGPSTPHLDWPLTAAGRASGVDEWHDHPVLIDR